MASWCIHTGQSPESYRNLTKQQRKYFTEEQNRVNQAGG